MTWLMVDASRRRVGAAEPSAPAGRVEVIEPEFDLRWVKMAGSRPMRSVRRPRGRPSLIVVPLGVEQGASARQLQHDACSLGGRLRRRGVHVCDPRARLRRSAPWERRPTTTLPSRRASSWRPGPRPGDLRVDHPCKDHVEVELLRKADTKLSVEVRAARAYMHHVWLESSRRSMNDWPEFVKVRNDWSICWRCWSSGRAGDRVRCRPRSIGLRHQPGTGLPHTPSHTL